MANDIGIDKDASAAAMDGAGEMMMEASHVDDRAPRAKMMLGRYAATATHSPAKIKRTRRRSFGCPL